MLMFSLIIGCILIFSQQESYKLLSQEKHDILASHIPDSKDLILNKIKNNSKLLIYTDKEIPSAYQDWTSQLSGIHSPTYNISAAKPQEKFGNPNVEFPWGKPAGTENVSESNFTSFKFILLPPDRQIEITKKYLFGDRRPSYVWSFPTNAIVGEVLQMYYKEKYYTFEVRIRTKENSGWRVSVYRPFSTLKEFADFCRVDGVQVYYHDQRITQSHQIFQGDVMATSLDSIPEALVKKALREKFVNVLGQEWHNDSHAPTTDSEFHIIPKNYRAATIAVNSKSCIRCHDSILKHANDFDFARDWYGRVRGSDGIFSFHPFEPSSISYNGIYQGEKIRDAFIKNRIVKFLD